jgi:hypothetical protein
MRSVPVIITVLAFLTSCSPPGTARVNRSRPLTPEETRIVAIARQAVTTNDTWVAHAEFELPRRRPEGGWSVMVWDLPATPGGFRIVVIDESGRVTDYVKGY